MSTHKRVMTVVVRAALALVVVAGVVSLALPTTGTPSTVPTSGLSPVDMVVTDMGDEVWWTTTDCPKGELVPCYDPNAFADRTSLPAIGIYVMQPGEVSTRMWDALLERGYRDDPTDQAERLYVPLEVAVSQCRTDLDCEQAYAALQADQLR